MIGDIAKYRGVDIELTAGVLLIDGIGHCLAGIGVKRAGVESNVSGCHPYHAGLAIVGEQLATVKTVTDGTLRAHNPNDDVVVSVLLEIHVVEVVGLCWSDCALTKNNAVRA